MIMAKKQCGHTVRLKSLLAIKLIEFFELEEIPYVIVGDSRSFPVEISGDLDIIVDSRTVKHISQILFRFCAIHNVHLIQILQHEQTAFYHVLAITELGISTQFLHPDICGDYFRDGKLLLKAEDMLSGRLRTGVDHEHSFTFFVPNPAAAFIYYLLKKIDKGGVDLKEGAYLSQEWAKDPVNALAQLKRFWSYTNIECISKAAAENRWEALQLNLPRLRKDLHQHLDHSLKNFFGEFKRILSRILKPTGVHVVFLGPDGSGKSTIVAKVRESLAPAFRHTKSYHLRPFFGSRPAVEGFPNRNPQGDSLRGTFSSIVKLGFWYLDFTLGNLIEVLPRKISSTLLFFDRYYFDILVDPQRYRYGGPKKLARMLGKLIPQPDIVILLDAPVEVIQARKQEVSVEESTRQRDAYLKLLGELKHGYVIDASKSLDEVGGCAEEIILAYMAARTQQRMRVSE